MLASKKTTLKPLLESADGLHLTAYLVNRNDLSDLKTQLREVIEQSYEWLNPVMTQEERNKFLEPLDSLFADARIFSEMKGNIGIFRNQDSFRVLNIPVDVNPTCQVATTFHVKPLLKWIQSDREFLLLGLDQEGAHLYLGSQSSFKLIESIVVPHSKSEETVSWFNERIRDLTKKTKPKLFLAGEKGILSRMKGKLRYSNLVTTPLSNSFEMEQLNEICALARKAMKAESLERLEKALFEFRMASEEGRVQKNLFVISRAVVEGRVRKLLVTEELNVFGKIDKKSGGISIHPFDLDHEDDDLLDDLAQMVLSQGGEVIVAKSHEIPKGRPILAILDDDGKDLSKTEDFLRREVLQERFG